MATQDKFPGRKPYKRLSLKEKSTIRLAIMVAIRQFMSANGYAPTRRELEAITGYNRRHIKEGIDRLEKMGELKVASKVARGITITQLKTLCHKCDGIWSPIPCQACDGSGLVPWLP